MGHKELRQQLRLFPTVISLRGRDDLRREEALADIHAIFAPDPDLRDFNVDTLRGAPNRETRAQLAEDPVGADWRLILLYADEPDAYLRSKGPRTVLVAVERPFTQSQLEIDCKRLWGKDLKQWIRSEARRQGVALDKEDADTLAALSGGSLRKLRGDLTKLSLYSDSFGTDILLQAAHSSLHTTAWDLLRHVLAGDVAKAADALQRVKTAGLPFTAVVSALQKEFLQLARLHAGAPADDLSDMDLERLERLRSRLPSKVVSACLEDLLATETQLKQGDDSLLDIKLLARLARRAA